MTSFDQTQRFLFDKSPVRGELTQLDQSLRDVLAQHNYPPQIANLLGQFMAATAMLADTIKFNGTLSLQVKGQGQVRTLMAECRDHTKLRAIAQYNDDFDPKGHLMGEGQMAITIEPTDGKRYQGLVAIDDNDLSLAVVLEDYFRQSEQIRTKIWLFANQNRAAGFMLQAMPTSAHESSLLNADDDLWERVTHLADTLNEQEILNLSADALLHRLFHEETVRLYEAKALTFECTCNEERSANAIHMLGFEEALDIVKTDGHILIDCQFCRKRYAYDEPKVTALFNQPTQ